MTPCTYPELFEALVTSHVGRVLGQYFNANSCINSTRVLLEVFRRFGLAARPFAVRAMIFSKGFVERAGREGRIPQGEAEVQQWCTEPCVYSLGLGFGVPGMPPDKWPGHLVVRAGIHYLFDATISQASRPARGIRMPEVLLMDNVPLEFWRGHEAAIAELEKVPASSSVGMGADYLLTREYRKVAEDYYQRIQQNNADSYRAHQLAAESFAWTGKYQNAILEYRKALQLDPDLEGAHRGIAEMYWEQHQFDRATQEFEAELQKFPLDDEAHLRIGEYLLSQGKVGEAVPQLETALRVDKKSWELDRALGQASMATDDMAKAQNWLESATQLNPSDALSHKLLGDVYRATGQPDRADREQAIFQKLSATEGN